MDKEYNIEDKTLDNVLKLIEHPQDLTDEELEEIMNNPSSMQAYEDMMLCRQAAMKEYSLVRPNVDKEWKNFIQKRERHVHKYLWGAFAGVAATLLTAFFCLQLSDWSKTKDGLLVFKSDDSNGQVTLTTDGDERRCVDLLDIKKGNMQSLGLEIEDNEKINLSYAHKKSKKKEKHILVTPRGKDVKVTLSDGTVVWLNSDSKLEYPSVFEGNERVVTLSGEAYFDVAKDKSHPFVIKGGQMQTRVLGTELNVRNYSTRDSHVTLIKGSAEVSDKEGNYTLLKPGEDVQLMNDGNLNMKNVDVDSYVYWKEGYFYFDDVPLVDIMQDIGRWYNVDIIFTNKSAMNYKMHFLCDRRSGLEHAVMILNKMKKVEAKISNNKLYIK